MSVAVNLRSPLSRWLTVGGLVALTHVWIARAEPSPSTEGDQGGWEGDLDAVPSSDPSLPSAPASDGPGATVTAAAEPPVGTAPPENAKGPSGAKPAAEAKSARRPAQRPPAAQPHAKAHEQSQPLNQPSTAAETVPATPSVATPGASTVTVTHTQEGLVIDPQAMPQAAQLGSAPMAPPIVRAMGAGSPRPEQVMRRQTEYLQQRFDLSGQTHASVKMSGERKAIPVGPTARLPSGVSWDALSRMTPAEIKKRGIFPYEPLWHPLQEVGGMVFPAVQTSSVPGLERSDVWFDLPDAYLPEFPPPLYLTSRPDLGDVSRGQLITRENVDTLFREVLTPTQLSGLKAMLERHPAQRHNGTEDRSTTEPSAGVACMDCHVNGHTTGQFSITPDLRPRSECFRVDTASLRGAFVQSWFGQKRALRTLEQFIASEPRTLYFDGDLEAAERKGGHDLEEEDVEAIAQFTRLIDFPPAPKLSARGGLDPKKASQAELRGEKLFGQHCASCHPRPWFTDNQAHDLKVERFYELHGSTRMGAPGRAEGAMKTTTLRGLKDSPPYLHDGRLLTLEDAVEFFNMVLQAKLTKPQRADLVEYLRTL